MQFPTRSSLIAVCCALLLAGTVAGRSAAAGVPDTAGATQVRLSWSDDPATTMTVRWRRRSDDVSIMRHRTAGTSGWTQAIGVPVIDRRDDVEVVITGLTPDTSYEYQLGGTDSGWGPTRSFRTAPDGGTFDAVFVADTGLAGRTDGLATGTRQIVSEIAALEPLLVLGGGDYVYFSSEDRYPLLGQAIDVWLEQMEPIIAQSAFMPTWGNHEVLLEEDVGEWIERFAMPSGTADRTSYSFDVAGVHFIALMAVEGVVDEATEAWLIADLEAATAAGARTIVPYLHRNVYGDGTSHPPSPSLARQLSRIFQPHAVDVVLTAHDQSYERTYPLVDGEPTSTNRHCYTPADGISWIKTSPGGKLSNIGWDFSSFSVTPPDPVVAIRARGLHHFTVVRFESGDGLEVVTYGVTGTGEPPVQVDAVRYAESCPPELSFATLPPLVELDDDGEPVVLDVDLVGEAGTLTPSVDWIAVTQPDDDGRSRLTVDPTGLGLGTHAGEVRADGEAGAEAVLPIAIRIAGSDARSTLIASAASDRTDPVVLDGARVRGEVYVELAGDIAGVGKVRFLVDGEPERSDGGEPFDLVGGSRRAAMGWDTTALPDGEHVVEAVVVDLAGDTTRTAATFTVANVGDAGRSSEVVGEPFEAPPPSEATTPPTRAPAVDAAPPVTFGPPASIVEPVDQDAGWWTSWLALVAGVVSVGAIAAAIGVRRRPAERDRSAERV